ncbi:hypothetical protein Tco_1426788 [Tanacetum coccineum]
MEEMMRECMDSQMEENEREKYQVVELEHQINLGLRNHQAIIENLERQFESLNVKIQPTESLPPTTKTKPRHEVVFKSPPIRNEHNKGDVVFIEEDEIEPILTMPNPIPIKSNSPTISPFLKDCTVHIPYTQEKVFEHDKISSHLGDEELKSIDGVGN